MSRPRILVLASAMLFLAPSAAAHDDVIVQRQVVGYYVHAAAHSHPEGAVGPGCPSFCPTPDTDTTVELGLWKETNGCQGLQRTTSTCSGATTPPDEHVRALSAYAP